MDRSDFLVLMKHCLLMGKNTFQAKQWLDKCYGDSAPGQSDIIYWYSYTAVKRLPNINVAAEKKSIFNELLLKATDQQQYFYELSCDWNVYKKDQRDYLYNYIGYAVYGPPEPPEDDRSIESEEEVGRFTYKEDEAKKINILFEKIIEFASPNKKKKKPSNLYNDDIYCVALYNVIFADKETISKFEHDKQKELEKPSNSVENPLESTIRDTIPVVIFKFKVKLKNGKKNYWFMDSDGRIYKNWKDYIENNTLLKCTMVLPKDGEYQPNPFVQYTSEETAIFIECHQSPACNKNELVSVLDTVNLVGGVGTIGVAVAAALTPLAPVVIATALVTGVASGVYSIGRSSARLTDKFKHEQDLVSKDTAADWLTIGSCTFGILSMGASKLLSRAVEKGIEIGKTGKIIHDSINGGSMIMNGVSMTYRSFDIYKKESKKKSDIFFLACDIFFLFNSVVNMKTAKNIIETQQTQMVEDYKNSLKSNRHRKAFDKLTKGADKTEIIREINKISQKDEFYAAVLKSRKTINAKEFSELSLKERVNVVSDFVPANSTETTGNACKSVLGSFFLKSDKTSLSNVNSQKFESVYNEIAKILNENAGTIMIELLQLGKIMVRHLSENDTAGDILASIVDFLWHKIKTAIQRLKSDQKSIQFIIDVCVWPLLDDLDNLISEWQDSLKQKYCRRLRESAPTEKNL